MFFDTTTFEFYTKHFTILTVYSYETWFHSNSSMWLFNHRNCGKTVRSTPPLLQDLNGSGAILAVLELSWLGGAPPQWCGESAGGPTPEKKNQY